MQVISMTGNVPGRPQEESQVDTTAAQVAAPVQPGFEPRTPSRSRSMSNAGGGVE